MKGGDNTKLVLYGHIMVVFFVFWYYEHMPIKELHLAHTQGFCAGVVNAIDIVELSI